jgi:hypothetical protein
MLLDGINFEPKRLITKFQTPLITTKTIFARNYGTAAVISYNLKDCRPRLGQGLQRKHDLGTANNNKSVCWNATMLKNYKENFEVLGEGPS